MMIDRALLACICACQATLAPAAFTPEEARRVYGESSSVPESGAIEAGGYVFMEVSWRPDLEASGEERDAQELAAVLDVLEGYVRPKSEVCSDLPFCRNLTSWMEPDFKFSFHDVSSATVKESSANGVCCKVMAFDAAALKAARSEAQAAMDRKRPRTDDDWLALLKDVRAKFMKQSEMAKFYTLLGCPVVNVVNARSPGSYGQPLEGSEACWKELQDMLELPRRPDSFFARNVSLAWFGVAGGVKGDFYPNWQEDDGGRFAKAVQLYRKGKEIQTIVRLLSESIEINPIGAEKWGYLGGALKVSGNDKDALFAYLQSLKFNSQCKWAWKGLRECCERCGFTENAKGLSWHLKMMDGN